MLNGEAGVEIPEKRGSAYMQKGARGFYGNLLISSPLSAGRWWKCCKRAW